VSLGEEFAAGKISAAERLKAKMAEEERKRQAEKSLLGGVVGGVGGFLVGGPAGAAAGFQVGSAIGSY
jgi:hypothetical protein